MGNMKGKSSVVGNQSLLFRFVIERDIEVFLTSSKENALKHETYWVLKRHK